MQRIAAALLGKTTIPSVAEQAVLLESVAGDEWWIDVTLPMLEARPPAHPRPGPVHREDPAQPDLHRLRGHHRRRQSRSTLPGVTPGTNFERFRAKAEAYLREHLEDHSPSSVFAATSSSPPTTSTELEQMLVASGGQQVDIAWATEQGGGLGIFVRNLVGLDRSAATEAFETTSTARRFSADQVRFVNLIVDELTKNGVMEPARLFESPTPTTPPPAPTTSSPTPTSRSSSTPSAT